MTDTEKNIAIATACGWFDIENLNTMAAQGIWFGYPPRGSDAIIGKKERIPDYVNDLNAMHLAEQALTFAQYQIFQTELCVGWTDLKVEPHPRAPLSAAASHRAEAFVRAIKELHIPSQ